MKTRKTSLVLLVLAATALIAVAQQPAPPAAAQTPPAQSQDENLEQDFQEIIEDPDAGNAYRYDPQGRRDPFRSLVGPAPQLSRENAPPGVAGFIIDELDLQGVVRTNEGFVAMVNGPDNNGYLLRNGDRVFDGQVIRITPLSVVFRQEVNDPTRIERFREVVKEITPQSEANRR